MDEISHAGQDAGEKIDPPDVTPITSKIATWLRRHGYPFELQVGRQLTDAGFPDVLHGRFYRDVTTGVSREIDVLAIRHVFRDGGPVLSAQLVVECKHGARPWIVMASTAGADEVQFPSRFLPGRLTGAVLEQAELPIVDRGSQHGTGLTLAAYGFDAIRGHNVVQADDLNGARGKDGDSRHNPAFNALQSVVAATTALAAAADQQALPQLHVGEAVRGAAFRLPVIVCNAPLFRLTLDGQNEPHVEAIEEIAVGAPSMAGDAGGIVLVRIVRPGQALQALAARALADVERTADILASQWPTYAQRAKQRLTGY